jgi:rod shape-determining protein MreD
MRNLAAFLALWLGLILESTVFQISPFNVIQPNFVLVVLVVIALVRGPKSALVFGVVIGFVQDADYGAFLGLNAFALGLVGYFAATTFAQFLHRNIAITFLVTVTCTFVFEWVTYGLTRLFDVTAYSWHGVLTLTLEEMIVNGITLLITYPLLIRILSEKTKGRYKRPNRETM